MEAVLPLQQIVDNHWEAAEAWGERRNRRLRYPRLVGFPWLRTLLLAERSDPLARIDSALSVLAIP